jgi:uncharacterized protein (TIGR02996 family)
VSDLPRAEPRPRSQVLAFLEDIKAHPEEDAPRLILADWLEEHGDPERAEFIRLQCEAASPSPPGRSRAELDQRVRQLQEKHDDAWLGPLKGQRNHCEFVKGLIHLVVYLSGKAGEREQWEAWQGTEFWAWVESLRLLPWGWAAPALREVVRLATSPLVASLASLEVRFEGSAAPPKVKALAASPYLGNLTSLSLEGNWARPQGAAALARSPHLARLRRLDLGRNQIGDKGVAVLAKSPHLSGLTTLWLAYNQIGAPGLRSLGASPHLARLTYLDLSQNPLGAGGPAALADATGFPALTTLLLNRCELGTEGARELAAAPLRSLRALELRSNNIRAVQPLLMSPHLAGLSRLDLGDNRHVGSGTINALSESPHLLSALTSLGLRTTGLSDDDVRVLTSSPRLGNLRELDLSDNQIGVPGAEALARAPSAAGLTVLNLSRNPLGNRGARALAKSPLLANLQALELEGVGIGSEGTRALAASPHLARIARLNLNHNSIGPDGQAALRKRFGHRALFS